MSGNQLKNDKFVQKFKKVHGNRALPEGIRRADIEYLDISDVKWCHVSISDRFSAALAQIDLKEAVEATGRSERQLLRYARGAEVNVSVLISVAECSEVPAGWIIDGVPVVGGKYSGTSLDELNLHGERLKNAPDRSRKETKKFREIAAVEVRLPRFDIRASAGAGALIISEEPDGIVSVNREWLSRYIPRSADVGVIEASGDSMYPTIRNRDILMIDVREGATIEEIMRGGIYVLTLDGGLVVKRLEIDGNELVVISDNPAYPQIRISFGQVESRVIIHGVVFWSGGALETHR